jgi:hypothetical protein
VALCPLGTMYPLSVIGRRSLVVLFFFFSGCSPAGTGSLIPCGGDRVRFAPVIMKSPHATAAYCVSSRGELSLPFLQFGLGQVNC